MKKVLKFITLLIAMGTVSAHSRQSIDTDAAALEYCQLNKNTYIALLYPCVRWDIARAKSIFHKYGTLVYEKRIMLTDNGPLNILRVAYANERWIGGYHDDFAKLKGSRKKRFPKFEHYKSYEVIALLFECDSLEKVLTCKKEIRRIFDRHPHPIHINDIHSETITMAQLVFQNTSINFSNSSKRIQFKRFDALLAEYKKLLADRGAQLENFCIVGSAVNAARGLQECPDLCFIHQGHDGFLQMSAKGCIRSVNATSLYSDAQQRDEIIFNPSKHFYHKNVKFAVQ